MIEAGEKSPYYFDGYTKAGIPIRIYLPKELARSFVQNFVDYAKRKQNADNTTSDSDADK